MDHHLGKGKITHLDVAKTGANNSATHVVTSIQYGADATFTFRIRNSQTEKKNEMSGELTVCGKKILKVLAGAQTGQADAGYIALKSDNDVDIECQFEGDFKIPQDMVTPTNYEEAIKFAVRFSQFLSQSTAKDTTPGNEDIGLPCFVTLYPLKKLPGAEGAPFLQNDILCDILTSDCVRLIENYEELEEEIQDLLNDSLGSRISPFHKKLQLFHTQFTSFRVKIMMKLRDILVEIRSGQRDVTVLTQLLERIRDKRFVFNPNHIKLWLADKHHELCMVKRFRDKLTDERLDREDRVLIFPTEKKSCEHMTATTVCEAIHFVFTSLASPSELFLQLTETTMLGFGDTVETDYRRLNTVDHNLGWHKDKKVVDYIQKQISEYILYVKQYMAEERLVFAMTALEAYEL